MAIRAVLCDLMDVLFIHDNEVGRGAWEKAHGVEPGGLERAMFRSALFRDAIAGRVREEALWRDVARTLDADPDQWAAMADANYSAGTLNLALADYLASLRPRLRTAILSNTPSDMRGYIIRRFGLDRYVDLIVISSEEGIHKPQPDIYRLTCDRLGVAPDEALMVDDEERYIAAAEALGMRGVRFTETAETLARIRAALAGDGAQ